MATYTPQDATGVLISDISKGAQTNDVKVTLDSEAITIAGAQTLATVTNVTTLGTITNAVAVTNAGITSIDGKMVSGTDIGDVTVNNAGSVNAVNIQDGGNTITVDGTITADLSATDNAVLDTMVTALQLIDNAVSGAGFNITQVNGETIDVGAGTEATAIRVTLPTDGTGVVKLGAGTAEIGKLAAGTAGIGKLVTNSGVDIGDVDVTSIIPGVGATNLGKAIDTALGATDTGVLALAVRDDTLNIRSGTENDVEPLHTDAVGALWTDPQGNVAHDAGDSGNPIKIGAIAITALSGATMVAAADRTNLYADEDGIQVVKLQTTNNDMLVERVSNTDGASTASTVFGATANCYNCITTIIVHNAHASTNGYVDIRDGTAGTVLATLPLPANGGTAISFPVPLRQTTVNTALAFDVSAAITTVYLTFIGYKSKA